MQRTLKNGGKIISLEHSGFAKLNKLDILEKFFFFLGDIAISSEKYVHEIFASEKILNKIHQYMCPEADLVVL